MKRTELIKRIEACGAVFVREGSDHTVYRSALTGRIFTVPRHREIDKHTANGILKEACGGKA